MGVNTNIQWCDATWNIARGCTKVDEDCKYCYMYRDSLGSKRYDPTIIKQTKSVFDMPLRYKETKSKVWSGKPLIFTSLLTDVFHEECDSFRDEMWEIIRKCPHLIFQILTKRPERITEKTPRDLLQADNIWFGTSVGSEVGKDRIYHLLEVDCNVRFISFEPLHKPVDMNLDLIDLMKIHWAIIGGESGNDNGKFRYRPCNIYWIESLIRDLTPYTEIFVKQMGTHLSKELKMSDRHGTKIEEFPKHLQIRNFPNI
jgi:protein gp37